MLVLPKRGSPYNVKFEAWDRRLGRKSTALILVMVLGMSSAMLYIW